MSGIESLSWPAITAASGGWLLFGILQIGQITGRWSVSRREADIYVKRAEKAEANVEKLIATGEDLAAVRKLLTALGTAALDAKRIEAGDGP